MAATEGSFLLERTIEFDVAVDEEAEEKGGDVLSTLSEGVDAEDELGAGVIITELVAIEPGDEGGEPVV